MLFLQVNNSPAQAHFREKSRRIKVGLSLQWDFDGLVPAVFSRKYFAACHKASREGQVWPHQWFGPRLKAIASRRNVFLFLKNQQVAKTMKERRLVCEKCSPVSPCRP